jgi:hypothetical protein
MARLFLSLFLVGACARGSFDEPTTVELGDASTVDPDTGVRPRRDASPTPEDGGGPDVVDIPDSTPSNGTCVGLLINEVQSDGPTSQTEFVEIYNPGAACSFNGWKLVYRSASGMSDTEMFYGSLQFATQGYAVLAGMDFSGVKNGPLKSGLAKDAGQLQLRDPSGQPSDSVGYGAAMGAFVQGAAAPTPPAGKSIGRSPNGVTTRNNSNDFKVLAAPTPGAANP